MLVCNFPYLIHVSRLTEEMHHDHRLGARRDLLLYLGGVEIETCRIDVGKDDARADLERTGRRGDEGVGGHDDFIYSLSRTGGLRWAFRVEGDVDAPPMLDADGTLYVGCDDGRLYALAGNAEEAAPEAESTDAGVQAVPSATPAAPAAAPGAAAADDDEDAPVTAAGSD